jgi:hypothetical protein
MLPAFLDAFLFLQNSKPIIFAFFNVDNKTIDVESNYPFNNPGQNKPKINHKNYG